MKKIPCSNRFEANLLKGNLENEGFHPVIFDFTFDAVYPSFKDTLAGEIFVAVPDDEYDEVIEYLQKSTNFAD